MSSQPGAIRMENGALVVPDHPIVPFIEGDGTGPDIWRASRLVLDASVEKAYGGRRQIAWREVLAGEKAKTQVDDWLPEETLNVIRKHLGGDQGPAHHAGRRRNPLAQRRAAPAARPLCLRAPGALVRGRALAGEGSRRGGHDHLPGEHRGHLRRHRVPGRHARGEEGGRLPHAGDGRQVDPVSRDQRDRHQAGVRGGIQAADPRRDRLCHHGRAARASPWCTRATS